MKAIYIRPVTEKVNLHTDMSILWAEYAKQGTTQSEQIVTSNEDTFFDEEEYDDEYDPFFDE